MILLSSPRNKNLNLLVQIKFLNLFLYTVHFLVQNKNWNCTGPNQILLVLGQMTCAHHEDYHNSQIHDRSLSWLGTGTSINSGGIKLALWAQTSSFSEMMWETCVYTVKYFNLFCMVIIILWLSWCLMPP